MTGALSLASDVCPTCFNNLSIKGHGLSPTVQLTHSFNALQSVAEELQRAMPRRLLAYDADIEETTAWSLEQHPRGFDGDPP